MLETTEAFTSHHTFPNALKGYSSCELPLASSPPIALVRINSRTAANAEQGTHLPTSRFVGLMPLRVNAKLGFIAATSLAPSTGSA